MKLRIFAIIAALLAGVTFSRANITGTSLADDGDGVIHCSLYPLQQDPGSGDWTLGIDGTHNILDSGHILGNIYTDSPTDPRLILNHSIDNDTGSTWTDYHVMITMGTQFAISNPTAGPDSGGSWLLDSLIQPTQVGSDWIGYVNYIGGAPITPAADPNNPDPSNTLDFSYKLTFNGLPSGVVSYCEQLTPSPVPEPGTLALLLCGLGAVAVRRRFTF
jgi:hypothetical protein